MEIIHGADMPYEDTPLKHRVGGMQFKTLSTGIPDTPENYSLSIARQSDFFAPLHHHNFDQFRFALQGDISLGPDMLLKEDQLSYHPEGAYYGPQKDEAGSVKVILLLQCGGASGQGYMTFDTLARANRELAAVGRFEGGKYFGPGGSILDGYQALWEHVHGYQLRYPEPRYQKPIIMDPKNFAWKKTESEGVMNKTLGVFSERELRAEQILVETGKEICIGGDQAIHLLFVLAGCGEVGSVKLSRETVVRLLPESSAVIVGGEEDLTMLHYVMPLLYLR